MPHNADSKEALVYGDVEKLIDRFCSNLESKVFERFVADNKMVFLSKLRGGTSPMKNVGEKAIISFFVRDIKDALLSVTAQTLPMTVRAMTSSMLAQSTDELSAIMRGLVVPVSKFGLSASVGEIKGSPFMRSRLSELVAQYVLFCALNGERVRLDIAEDADAKKDRPISEPLGDVEDLFHDAFTKTFFSEMRYHIKNPTAKTREGVMVLPGQRSQLDTILDINSEASSPFGMYGSVSFMPTPGGPSALDEIGPVPVDAGADSRRASALALTLDREFRWNVVFEALRIIRADEIKFHGRRDSAGDLPSYGPKYKKINESDKNTLLLFIISRVLAVPFSDELFFRNEKSIMQIIVDNVVEDKPATRGIAKDVERAHAALYHNKQIGSLTAVQARESMAKAAMEVAKVLVAYICSETRRSTIPAPYVADPEIAGTDDEIETPFERMYAVYDVGGSFPVTEFNFEPEMQMSKGRGGYRLSRKFKKVDDQVSVGPVPGIYTAPFDVSRDTVEEKDSPAKKKVVEPTVTQALPLEEVLEELLLELASEKN